jgi:hypothetical protein
MIHLELAMDSFVASIAVGAWLAPRRPGPWIWGMAMADALATVVASVGWGSPGVAVGIVIAAVAVASSPRLVALRPFALPLLLCIDNLVAPARAIDAPLAGLLSGASAAAGFAASAGLRALVERIVARRYGTTRPSAMRSL